MNRSREPRSCAVSHGGPPEAWTSMGALGHGAHRESAGGNMKNSVNGSTYDRRSGTVRRRRLRVMAAVVVAAATLLWASSGHAACSIDLQGADDEPGQKDMSQFCLVGACGGSRTGVSWRPD